MFSHWIYHHPRPHAVRLQMGHAAHMKALRAGKQKSDKIDARTIADLVQCNLLPGEYRLFVGSFRQTPLIAAVKR